MSWSLFSDWGAASWSEDVEAATAEALALVATVAEAKGWTADQRGAAEALVLEVAELYPDSAVQFWAVLAQRTAQDSAIMAAPNADKVVATWESAANAAQTTADGRDAGSFSEVVSGTMEQSASDSVDMWEAAKPWLGAGLVVVGLAKGAELLRAIRGR